MNLAESIPLSLVPSDGGEIRQDDPEKSVREEFLKRSGAWQRSVLAFQADLYAIIESNPELDEQGLDALKNRFATASEESIGNDAMSLAANSIDLYRYRHTQVAKLAEVAPDSQKLFSALFGTEPTLPITTKVEPLSVYVHCTGEEDFETAFLNGPLNGGLGDLAELHRKAVRRVAGFQWKGPSGVPVIVTWDRPGSTAEDGAEVYLHERQHILNSLVRDARKMNVAGQDEPVTLFLEMIAPLAPEDVQSSEVRKALTSALRDIRIDRVDWLAQDELLAQLVATYKVPGSGRYRTPEEVVETLLLPVGQGGMYDHGAIVKKSLESIPASLREPIGEIVEEVFGDQYANALHKAAQAFERLKDGGLTLDQCGIALRGVPMREWDGVARRMVR
jgi:hypothetical protein